MQSQSSTANEIVQDSETQRTGVKRCSLRTTKVESLKEADDELDNQQLRAHVLDDDKRQNNELGKNQIEVKIFLFDYYFRSYKHKNIF